MTEINFDEALERIRSVTGKRTQVEIADYLSIRQSSISDAKRRNSIPGDWLVTLVEREAVNPEWIKYGTEPRYIKDPAPHEDMAPNPELLTLRDLFTELKQRFSGATVTLTF